MRFFLRTFFVLLSFFALTSAVQAALPPTPSGLSAMYNSSTGLVYIYWTDNANDEMGFQLFRKLSSDSSWPAFYVTTFGAVTQSAPYSTQSNDSILQPGTYDYKLRAYNADGHSEFSNVASVTVGSSSGSDQIKPTMPSNFTVSATTLGQINLSWGASTDNVGVSGYKIFRCWETYDGCTNFSQLISVGSGATSYTDTYQIYGGMTYRYYMFAYDQVGNYSDITLTVSVVTPYDTTSPSAPSNLTASAPSATQVYLSWSASTDNVGVSQYAVYRNNSYLGYTTSCCSYTDSSVTSGGTYTYYVTAYDARSNISPQSNSVTITTPSSNNTSSSSDTTPPVWPSGYTFGTSILSSASIKINWTAAVDPTVSGQTTSGMAGYKIYRNGTQITTTILLEYTDSGLAPSTTYSYAVTAVDGAGNISSQINFSPVTTWGDTSNTTSTDTTAPIITNVRADNVIGSGAQIKWSTDDLSNSRLMYGLSAGNLSNFINDRCDGAGYVTSHCVNLTNLTANIVYYYKVKSLNNSGLDAESAVYQFTAASSSSAADTTPPTPPTAVSSYAVSASSISISWSGAVDPTVSGQTASGLSGYKIYRNGTFLSTTSALSYTDSGLLPSTSYYYTVAVIDGAGNLSGMSISTTATTMTNTDTTTNVSYASLSGKVTNSIGAAVTGANVYFNSSDRYYSAITDNTGQYALGSVYPGSYDAKVYGPSGAAYQSVSKSITLTAGQAAVLNFQFTASSKTIKGKISYPDGRPVTNAGIGAYNSASGAWTSGYANEQGTFTLQVSGGNWQINIYPKYAGTGQTNDWSYMEPPREVSFKDDTSIEEATIDFIVKGAQVSVKGYVFLPDGTAAPAGVVSVSLRSSSGFEHRLVVDSSGMFFTYLSADTYKGEIFSTDSRYGGVEIAAFSAVSGTVDLGKFYLKTHSGKIKGTVKDLSGNPVADAWINANNYILGKYARAKSAMNGSFEIPVSAGEWSVQAYSDPMLGYSYNQPPKFVTVTMDGTAEAHFVMTKNDAQISGNIVDASGQIVSDAYGYISTYVSSANMTMYAPPSFGGQIEKGSFSFKLPAGTYALNVYFSSNSGYLPPEPQSVTVVYGETKKINLAIAKTDVVLSGFLKDDAGNIIKGLGDDKVKVYLSAKGGAWNNAKIDASTGSFSAQISAGTWYLGYWADSNSGYVSSGKDIEINAAAGESKKVDITLFKANSVISGTVKTSDGAVLPNVWMSVNTRSFTAMSGSTGMAYGSSYIGGVSSDASGKFEIKVPPGKYFIQSSHTMTSGYLIPPEIETTVESGKTVSIEIVFKKPDAALSGVASVDGKGVPAYVWAWRESGGYVSTRADDYGKYSFSISRNSKWRAAASYEKNGVYYKTEDVVVEIGDQAAVTQDLTLLSLTVAVPATVEKVVETVKPQSVELQNGAKVVLPANALATSGSANVVMKPEVEVPSVGSTSVVGTGYRVEAKDEKGQGITNLNTEITVSIPYDEADLAAKGIGPEDLTLSFFDETTQTWKPIDKQVVDKDNKIVSGAVSHLTLFALVAPADTTPPPAPGGTAVSLISGGIQIVWKNQTADFHHTKIYRSSQKGVLGDVLFNYLTAESKTDSTGNSSHYYVVRAVDLAGNESANTAQYQVGASMAPQAAESAVIVIPSAQSGMLLVRVEGDPRVYVIENSTKRWIKSPEEFNVAGYKWSEIVLISASEMAGYPDQSAVLLARVEGDLKVYVVENGKKRWIKSPEEFNAAGYRWGDIVLISASQLAGYPDEAILQQIALTLKIGMQGDQVRALQQILSKDKTVYPRGLVTGYFGKLTLSAVILFQKKHKIIGESGITGPKTRQKLNENEIGSL